MGMFNRRKTYNSRKEVSAPMSFLSPDYQMDDSKKREIAIEYINTLSKRELELFIEGAQLIWQGYGILNRVKTPAEKREEKEAKEDDVFDVSAEEELSNFLDLENKNGTPRA